MTTVRTGEALEAELQAIKGELKKKLDRMIKKLVLDGLRSCIVHTAVDTGYLRSNWAVTTGTPSNGVGGGRNTAGVKFGDKVTVYNNTKYARYLEHGTPTNRAQPMIQPTVQMLESAARRMARSISVERVK
jgi:HK97 gp10 family phage protein